MPAPDLDAALRLPALRPGEPPRARVMGILNVTPDSFSDGGRWDDAEHAVAAGLAMADAGADLVDVGGESTRPGAARPDLSEELDRVLPVVSALARAGVAVSVDTMRAEVARASLEAGAVVVNDVSGGLADPEVPAVAGAAGAVYVAMHWRAHSATMAAHAHYDDVVSDVRRELAERVEAVLAAGVTPDRLVLDPGLGFAKDAGHNWALLARLEEITSLGYPVLVGASRKRFLGGLLATTSDDGAPVPRPVDEREHATSATSALAARAGAWAVRVHAVRASLDAVRVAAAWRAAGEAAADGGADWLAGGPRATGSLGSRP